MMRWLQEFGFQKSSYERPNQKWVCGRARDGQCCLTGPDASGNCGATAECRPLRKGDRWHCSRSNAMGGACSEGPLPDGSCCRTIPRCTPNRSLRSWRGITVLLVVGATLGLLLVSMSLRRGANAFSPGELSFSHRSVGNKCSECHYGLEGRPAVWFTTSVKSPSAHDNSQLCLKCHNLSGTAMYPHSLAPERLQSLTQASMKKNGRGNPSAGIALASFVPSVAHVGGGEIACATCHKEHNGKAADLKKLTNNQCQGCHATQFASLSAGHPQFAGYPFERRTRIIFDHETHLLGHFNEATVSKMAPHSCMDCHEPDLRGGTMVLKSFASTCAACHDDQIKAKSAVKAGVPFIAIPRMDDRVLKGKYSIGEWPEDADQPITPFVKFLLSGDAELRNALNKIKGLDLSSLPSNDVEKLQAAQQVAWGIKSLIFDLSTLGQDELVRRINHSSGRTLSDYEKEGAVAFLNAEVIRGAFQSAFPNLQKEVVDYRKKTNAAPTQLVSSPEAPKAGPVKTARPEDWVSQGGWYSPDASFTLNYHPRGHSDRFLSAWMNLTVDGSKAIDSLSSEALFKELSASKGVGLCVKCHSIDDSPAKLVNWMGSRPDPVVHGFERFSHSAHLSLMDSRGCLTCHSMSLKDPRSKGTDDYASTFEPGKQDPSMFHSNFKVIDKNVCASCHQSGLVRDDCLLCHNYHIGKFKQIAPHASIFGALHAEVGKD